MARNKFIRDYRLTERTDERGKTRRDYAYVGDAYHYVFPADAVRRTKRNLLICCAVGFAAFLGALLPRSAAAYIIYITLPFVFSALPLGIAAEAVLTAPRPDRPMERRQADKLENRLPAAAVFVVILPAVS
ncbi:MAG: hypothetical protein IJ751_06200, partial [Oscillospiraceae bacterium]|nr:hypothetical protein [Oscillospiraceae bacterium]